MYSVAAIACAFAVLGALLALPQLRELHRLLVICLVGMIVNVGLMFIVLRDIFLRRFVSPNRRFVWVAVVLLVWPAIVYYLFRHGFHPRN